jgi:hypothetical protein
MKLARYTLALVWLGTAVASLHDGGRAGAALLPSMAPDAALATVWLGSAWDAALGLALLLRPNALVCRLAALGVVAMTALATLLLPALWLDPFGPLLKNLPLLALLWQLDKKARA